MQNDYKNVVYKLRDVYRCKSAKKCIKKANTQRSTISAKNGLKPVQLHSFHILYILRDITPLT